MRLSYERHPRVYKRQSVFFGTTNDHDYLEDPTGARRYWPIHVKVAMIDTERLADLLPQIMGRGGGRSTARCDSSSRRASYRSI